MAKSSVSAEVHDRNLEAFKSKQHIQQFWTIPLSNCIREIDWT